jgi:ectoine hydroxylase-related dioxygenase (phytanoyl-CoA dioxygenase family)
MLDQQLCEHYWDKGWVVIENVFSRDACDELAAFATSIAKKQTADADPANVVDRTDAGDALPRKINHPFLLDKRFRDFVLDTRLVDTISGLIGQTPLICTDQIFMKPPRFGSAKPYHQDNAYFKCSPADHVITAWIALDDVDASNGCLRYIDGSHKGEILPHVPIPGEEHNLAPQRELIDLRKESLAIVGKGGVVFHHSVTLHTSHRNESDRWRRAYATHWVTADVTSESTVLENAYFRSGKSS